MTSTRNKGIGFPMEMVRLDYRNYVSSGKFVIHNIKLNRGFVLQR